MRFVNFYFDFMGDNLLKKDFINLSWIWDKEMMLCSPQQTEPQTFGLHDVMFTAELQIDC